jgi:ceramide glucosyltransferase
MLVALALLLVAAAGLLSCTGYLILLWLAAWRFRRRMVAQVSPDSFPPVTLLKPLCGLEPNLRANLTSFFDQEYPSFEVVFGVRHVDDPALSVVDAVRQQYPSVPVKVVIAGEPAGANAKICSLQKMYAAAAHDYLVISDSDVQVHPNYIRHVIAPLLNPRVGMVTCLYRGVPGASLWSRLEALGMSVEMTSGVLVANLLEGMKFALGPTMAIRREVLDAVSGFEPLADYCADDYLLGQRVAQLGREVVLSTHVIDHVAINRALRSSLLHQVRWMKSTRFSRPVGHIATVMSFAMPFGILGFIGLVLLGRPLQGLAWVAAAITNRVLMSVIAGWMVVRDWQALRSCWLYPIRDLMGFGFWLFSFLGNTITWRGETYRLELDGFMVPAGMSVSSLAGCCSDTRSSTDMETSLAAGRIS